MADLFFSFIADFCKALFSWLLSRRVNPYDNALAEEFFSILKTGFIYRRKIDAFKQAQRLIDDYIWLYNIKRIQLKTKPAPLVTESLFAA